MTEELSAEEVGILIRARRILRQRGLSAEADVSAICKAGGVSRKTGYQWAQKQEKEDQKNKEALKEYEDLQVKYSELKKEYEWINFQNEGRKLAWEIHHVDEWLASKKNASVKGKGKKR